MLLNGGKCDQMDRISDISAVQVRFGFFLAGTMDSAGRGLFCRVCVHTTRRRRIPFKRERVEEGRCGRAAGRFTYYGEPFPIECTAWSTLWSSRGYIGRLLPGSTLDLPPGGRKREGFSSSIPYLHLLPVSDLTVLRTLRVRCPPPGRVS